MLKCTLGQPPSGCEYTARLLDFLLTGRGGELHLPGCRDVRKGDDPPHLHVEQGRMEGRAGW